MGASGAATFGGAAIWVGQPLGRFGGETTAARQSAPASSTNLTVCREQRQRRQRKQSSAGRWSVSDSVDSRRRAIPLRETQHDRDGAHGDWTAGLRRTEHFTAWMRAVTVTVGQRVCGQLTEAPVTPTTRLLAVHVRHARVPASVCPRRIFGEQVPAYLHSKRACLCEPNGDPLLTAAYCTLASP